jgi:hypothetical protein
MGVRPAEPFKPHFVYYPATHLFPQVGGCISGLAETSLLPQEAR